MCSKAIPKDTTLIRTSFSLTKINTRTDSPIIRDTFLVTAYRGLSIFSSTKPVKEANSFEVFFQLQFLTYIQL